MIRTEELNHHYGVKTALQGLNLQVNPGDNIAEGKEDIAGVGTRMYHFVLEVASGRKTFSELLGHREFVPWRIGPVL
jgi:altronate dehydratase